MKLFRLALLFVALFSILETSAQEVAPGAMREQRVSPAQVFLNAEHRAGNRHQQALHAELCALPREGRALLGGDIERLPAERLLSAGTEFHEELIKLSRNPFYVQALERVDRLRRLIDYRSLIDRQRYY